MTFWVLIVLAAAPLAMAALMFLMLRSGAIRRLHEKRYGVPAEADPGGGCEGAGGD